MLGVWEIVLIILFIAIFLGPNKIPEFFNYLKKGTKEFKKSLEKLQD